MHIVTCRTTSFQGEPLEPGPTKKLHVPGSRKPLCRRLLAGRLWLSLRC